MKKLAGVLGGAVLVLAAAELLLRLIGYGVILPEHQFEMMAPATLTAKGFETDPKLFWSAADGSHDEYERRIRSINPHDPIPPKTDRFRVICLGDSCTKLAVQGWPFSFLLQQQLAVAGLEVFNAGISGYSSYQGLVWLRDQLLSYEPDLVIVYFGWHDHWRSRGLTDAQYAEVISTSRLRLLRLFDDEPEQAPLRVPLPAYRENLRRMAELVSERGGHVLLVTAPSYFTPENEKRRQDAGAMLRGDDTSVIHTQYLQAVRELAGNPEPRVFDAASVFNFINDHPFLLRRDGVHLTDLGHHLLAMMLSEFVYHHYLGGPAPAHAGALGLVLIGQNLMEIGRWREAAARLENAVAAAPRDLGPTLTLAWLLATCPDASVRDGARALLLLEPLQLRMLDNPHLLEVTAAAFAEVGQYDQAVAAARQAVQLAAPSGDVSAGPAAGMQARLELYASGRPYRLVEPAAP